MIDRIYSITYAVIVAALCVVVRHFVRKLLSKNKNK